MNRMYISDGVYWGIFSFDEIVRIYRDRRIIVDNVELLEGDDYCKKWLPRLTGFGMYPRWVDYRGKKYQGYDMGILRNMVETEKALEAL